MTPAEQVTFGDTIRERRKALGLTATVVAARCGVTKSYLCDMEHDTRTPAEEVMERLAEALGVDSSLLYAKAGKLPESVRRYLRKLPLAVVLLNTIARADLGAGQLEELIVWVSRIADRKGAE